MIKYIKCPRCELNYINEDKQEYCDVCIAEMKGSRLKFADLDELEEVAETELEDICPVCGVSTLRPGEKMCDSCRLQQEYEEDEDVDMEKDEEWKNYLEEEEENGSSEPAIQLDLPEEEYDDFEEEDDEDEQYEDEDPLDDFEDLDDIDYDDEDDEDDEDDYEDF